MSSVATAGTVARCQAGPVTADRLAAGDAALARADEAFARFDVDGILAHLSTAVRELTVAGDNRRAAVASARLGDMIATTLGNLPASRAWFARARRLVADEPPCIEQGWVAVAAMDTLVVPTIFDADRKSLGQISRDARAVIEKVRDKTVTPPELSGGTFTVSNLGMYGIEHFTAIINPPQASILTVGALAKRPAVDDNGRVVARDQMTLSLVCDHRILYGADGAQFLARVKELLEQPLSLAL